MKKLLLLVVAVLSLNLAFSISKSWTGNFSFPSNPSSLTNGLSNLALQGIKVLNHTVNNLNNNKDLELTELSKSTNLSNSTSTSQENTADAAMFFADVAGDYRSKAAGLFAWNLSTSWQVYNGTTWVNATSYPGQTAGNNNVIIQAGHTITINGNPPFQPLEMGNLTINGTLSIGGGDNNTQYNIELKTNEITIGSSGSIFFNGKKINLTLPNPNAVIIVLSGGSITASNSNCGKDLRIFIGSNQYAGCNPPGGSTILTFGNVVTAGGTINAQITNPSTNPTDVFGAVTTNLSGRYIGADTNVSYLWTVRDPNNITTTITSGTIANSTVTTSTQFTPSVPGEYLVALKVTTSNNSFSNTETRTFNVLDCSNANATTAFTNVATDGFGDWTFIDSGNSGHFTSSSTTNGNGDQNGDGDINSSGTAWGLFANSGQTADMRRPFDELLGPGSTFSIQMDNGFIDGGGTVGFGLRNSAGNNLIEFYFRNGQSNYKLNALDNETDTGIGFSVEGLKIDFTLVTQSSVAIVVTELFNGNQHNFTKSLKNPAGGQLISQLRMFNVNAGFNAERNAYFNKLVSCVEPVADADGDGFSAADDCDDNNAAINPGAQDICDGIDNNCNGQIDENPAQVDYANLQSPGSATICDGQSLTAYGQVFEPGVTPGNGLQGLGIDVEFGYNATDNNPAGWSTWTDATFNPSGGGDSNDEYQYTFTPPSIGTYYYTFRYSLNGCDWQYGGFPNGFWNGSSQNNGVLTVLENHTLSLFSGNTNQNLCPNTPIAEIDYNFGGGATSVGVTNLPAGVSFNPTTGIISGSPTVSGTFNYTVTTVGNICTPQQLNGTITVKQLLDYANLQFPANATVCLGNSLTAYGQVYEQGLTDTTGGRASGIAVEFGYNTSNTNPSSWTNWFAAAFNTEVGNNDEYQYTFNPSAPGTYYYTFRYSLNGCEWQYGGYDTQNIQFDEDFWDGTNDVSGVLTVNSAPVINTVYTNISVSNDPGQCGAVVNYAAANATGVPSPTITYSKASGTIFPVGTTTVTVTATNSCGSVNKMFNVTVTDNQPPAVITQNITVNLNASGTASIIPSQVNNGSNDNCGTVNLVSVSPNTFNCTNVTPVTSGSTGHVVISQVYGGGGNTGATFRNDFIELFNAGTTSVNLSGWSVQYASATGTSWLVTSLSGTIQPGQYFLVQGASSGAIGTINPTPDISGSTNLSATAGKVLLANTTTAQSGPCPTGSQIIDFVGFGTTANCFEGSGTTSAPSNTNSIKRNSNGCTDTNNNSADFATATPTPRNSASPLAPCAVTPSGTPVILTVTDTNGNSATGTAYVTVRDLIPPVLSPASNQNVNLSSTTNTCQVTIPDVRGTATDNCAGTVITQSPAIGATPSATHNSTINVTVTATDASGNTDVKTVVLTAKDITPPMLTPAANQNVTLNASCQITVPNVRGTATDNCAGTVIVQNPTAGTVIPATHNQVVNVTVTATDLAGLTDVKTVVLTPKDLTAPTVVTQNITVSLNASGNASITPAQINNGSTDNCGTVNLVSVSPSAFTCADVNGDAPTELFISEYIEGSGNNKYIELYNGTGSSINLSSYLLSLYVNESSSPTSAGNLSGIIAPGGTAVFRNSSASLAIGTSLTNLTFNGNDAVALRKSSGEFVDIIGQIGFNPGSEWGSGLASTADNTLRRKSSNTTGDTNGTDAFNPSSQWDGFATDDFSGLGTHSVSGAPNVVTLTVNDGNGNTATGTANVTVIDNIVPIITCVPNSTHDTDPGLCQYTTVGSEFDATFTDNCSNGSISNNYNSLASLAGAVFPKGTTTVVWTVNDGNGQTATCQTVITVEDNEVPIITCVPNSTRDTDPGLCQYTTVGSEFDATFTDNCSNGSISNNYNSLASLAGAIFPKGTTTVVWTVNDGNGQSGTCTTTITVEDNENPVIACIASDNRDTDPGECDYTIVGTEFDATFTDNCADGNMTNDYNNAASLAGAVFQKGATIVTWTVNDGNGQSATCTTTITVEDNENPVIACIASDNRDTDPGECDYTIVGTEFDATFTDNCADGNITNDYNNATSLAGAIFQKGATIVTWTVNDGNGQSATCTTSITVEDNEVPVITCVPNSTRDTDPGLCQYTTVGTEFNATFIDNCSDGSITNDYNNTASLAGAIFQKGTTTVVWTVNDGNGQTATCTTVITVEDNESPVVTCTPNSTTRNTNSGVCQYTTVGTEFDATFTDNCIDGSIKNDYNNTSSLAGAVFPKGTTTVVWTVDDGNGQSATCTTTITVEDNEAPIISCRDLEVYLNDNGAGTITAAQITQFANDNCEIASITISQSNFDCSDIGGDLDDLIISEYVDGSNFENYIELYNGTGVTVDLTEYSLLVYYNGSSTPDIYPLGGSVADRMVSVISHPSAQFAQFLANNTVLLDFDGNDAVALTHNGVIIDLLPVYSSGVSLVGTTLVRKPDVNNGNVSNSSGSDGWLQLNNAPVANLGSHNIVITDNENNVELTVTDTSGNTSTCIASVTVIDSVPPVVTCQNLTVQLNSSGTVSITADAVELTSSDACGIAGLTLDNYAFTCENVGPNTVTLTATDRNGNSTTCTATVTVVDDVDPTVITQNITVQLDASGAASITASQIDNGSNDACGIASVTVSPNTFNCSNVGSNTVTLTVTDNNNNVATETATVTVEDNEVPVAVCQNITVALNANGSVSIIGSDVNGGSTDACGIASYEVSPSVFGCSNIGANNVVLTVTDVNGNTSTCNAVVTITGIVPIVSITESPLPEFCQGAVVVLTANTTQPQSDIRSYAWSGAGVTGPTDEQSVSVTGNGTYTVVVTSETNCSTTATYTVTGFDAGALISSYTILATEDVFLHGNNLVQTGAVGVTASNGLIKLHQASTIVGRGQAANFNLNQGSTIGVQVNQPANPIIPAFIYNTQSTSSSPDVTVNNNQSQTLGGSVYDVITIKQGATVTFSQPNVFINEIKTFENATINFTGCTNVYLNEKFMLARGGTINSTGENVVFYVDADVQIEQKSSVRARIHLNGNEILAKGANANGNSAAEPTYMTGLFIANKVQGNKNVIWNSDTVCEPCGASSGGAQPPVANNGFKLSLFTISTWPNPSDTEFNIKLNTENLDGKAEIKVFDMNNKLVFSSEFGADETYRFGKELQGGVYIVRVTLGKNMASERVIKY